MSNSRASLVKEYEVRINRVVDHISRNLASPLPLRELSEISAFSPYHFHRLFRRVMNESVHRFINRLRVEKAAKMLLFHPERTISDIALECGLGSSAHFSRAFRSHMGQSATAYREQYHLQAAMNHFKQRQSETTQRLRLLESKLERVRIPIETLPERHAVCCRYYGTMPVGEVIPGIAAAFDRAEAWLQARDLLTCNSRFIGVIADDPYIAPASMHRYAACVTTPSALSVPPGSDVDAIVLPGGKYAVVHLEDTADIVYDLIYLIHIQWLPLSPYQWDDSRPEMEIFYGNPQLDPQRYVRIDFCIPIKPK